MASPSPGTKPLMGASSLDVDSHGIARYLGANTTRMNKITLGLKADLCKESNNQSAEVREIDVGEKRKLFTGAEQAGNATW